MTKRLNSILAIIACAFLGMSAAATTAAAQTELKIAFTSYRDGNAEIYVMDADGSNQTNLTMNNSSTDLAPAWSPAGNQIAFYSLRGGNAAIGNIDIYVMDADGSNQTNLTNRSSQDYEPAWSPDGTKIAFYSNRDGNYEIYVMDADGSNQTNLTNHALNDFHPAMVSRWNSDCLHLQQRRRQPRNLFDGCRWFQSDESHEPFFR